MTFEPFVSPQTIQALRKNHWQLGVWGFSWYPSEVRNCTTSAPGLQTAGDNFVFCFLGGASTQVSLDCFRYSGRLFSVGSGKGLRARGEGFRGWSACICLTGSSLVGRPVEILQHHSPESTVSAVSMPAISQKPQDFLVVTFTANLKREISHTKVTAHRIPPSLSLYQAHGCIDCVKFGPNHRKPEFAFERVHKSNSQ